MTELNIRRAGRAGRITLTRPQALNALSHQMIRTIHATLDEWRDDPGIELVVIDAEGSRAFCAGGDVSALYRSALAGNHDDGRRFFADEYRMNAAIHDWPKPIVSFMQGFVMGGGVGVGGHASHRIVGDSTQMAMPEAGIGLIPDIGSTWLLARAPGRIGEYLGLTGARIGAGDAIHAGFADIYLPESEWPDLIRRLENTGNVALIESEDIPSAPLQTRDLSAFAADTVAEIMQALDRAGDTEPLNALRRNSPLSLGAALQAIRAARDDARMQDSLSREYRFSWRATESSDLMEGVRAQIIDKDRNPKWRADASPQHIRAMLAPLGKDELQWSKTA